jgi:predicted glutamine amidotransferase
MCTIMTFDNDTFQANRDAILERIKQDGNSNDDGWNLIIAGKKESDAIFLQVLKIDMVLAILSATQNMVRFWVHARRSTTQVSGLSGCHGFRSYTGWFVQHNGVLNSGRAKSLPVDSMVISELLEYMTPNHVAEWLLAKESYANVFMINPTIGTYHVVRCSSGSLHTDNRGNFSSNSIAGICDSEVPRDFHTTNTFPVEKETSAYSYDWNNDKGYNRYNSRWDWDNQAWRDSSERKQTPVVTTPKTVIVATPKVTTVATTPSNKEVEADVDDVEWDELTDEECIAVLPELTFNEVRTLYYEKMWDVSGVPKDVILTAPKKQRNWLTRLERVSTTTQDVAKAAGGGSTN